jgi:adenosine tuberculosinyltransferase
LNITPHEFESLPLPAVAEQVQAAGPLVCVFPINGTRRWYALQPPMDGSSYLSVMEQQHINLYKLFFEHGIHTLLTPIFGPDLLERGEEYVTMAIHGMARLVTEPHFLDFYEKYQVRVRCYGDYRRYLANTSSAYLIDLFDQISERTRTYNQHRLFFGLFANDPTETVAALSVEYYLVHQRIPDRQTLVSLYYGEPVEPVNFFLGFDRLSAFDMPLIATGAEDLYFTVSPSLDLTDRQLRQILYDHLYTRRGPEPDYEELSPADAAFMQAFYSANHEKTIGLGALKGGIWYPLPSITWPAGETLA